MEEKSDLENGSPGAEIQVFAQNRFEIFFSSLLQRVGNRRKDRTFTQQVLLRNSTVCFNYNFANKTDEGVITATAS